MKTNKQTVLVTDDSDYVRNAMKVKLEELGYIVYEAVDGEDALKLLCNESITFNMLITDYNMPNIDGLELVAALRTDPKYAKYLKIPIVMATAQRIDTIETKALESGVNAVFSKTHDLEWIVTNAVKYL